MSTLMVVAGGTGGHVFPALAVAEVLRTRGVEIVWLGTEKGIEARVASSAGIEMERVQIQGVRGHGILRWIMAPFHLLFAMAQALAAILRRRPDALLGMGGFVAGPGGLVAWLLRCPLVIHEQNAVAGMTNRILSLLATRVLLGFPETKMRSAKRTWVGNPVRKNITALSESPPCDGQGLRLLVVGGSLGAQVLNTVVPQAVKKIAVDHKLEVRHQSGRGKLDAVTTAYQPLLEEGGAEVSVTEFIGDMAESYSWADMVICRAGAMTVSELAIVGLPAILVPYPYAVNDHQTANAQYLVDNGAAHLIQERGLTPASLVEIISEWGFDRARLEAMGRAARLLGRPGAADEVADVCQEVMHA